MKKLRSFLPWVCGVSCGAAVPCHSSRCTSTLASTSWHGRDSNAPSHRQQACLSSTEKRLRRSGEKLARRSTSAVLIKIADLSSTLPPQGIRCCEDLEGAPLNTDDRLQVLLNTCISTPSAELYEELIRSSAALYRSSAAQHWGFYARVLANYGVQCLVDQNTGKAVEVLRKAIEIISFFEADTAVLHLRVLLANAAACEGQYFAALCEYESCLAVMRDFPVESSLRQLVSGSEMYMPLSRSYINEDYDRFLEDEEVVLRALGQGQKQADACVDKAEKARVAMTMARLQRRRGEKDASLTLYTSALRMLLGAHNPDLEIQVLHDIGLLLCFEVLDVTQGLPYLQAAAEMACDRARVELNGPNSDQDESGPSHSSYPLVRTNMEKGLRARRAVLALVDTAVCYAENDEVGKSLGFFEEAKSLMTECGMQEHSAWICMKYADALSSASLLDAAIRIYLDAMDTIRLTEISGEKMQLACMGMGMYLTQSEVEGRLAHCFQTRVGDYRRACVHYCQSIRRCGVAVRCPFQVSQEGKTLAEEEIDPETLCWMLEKYADCCVRVGNVKIAKEVLEHRVRVEQGVGTPCAAALLHLAELHSNDNVPRAIELYTRILSLPQDAVEPDTLLQSAYNFIAVCYQSKDEDFEAGLSNVQCSQSSGQGDMVDENTPTSSELAPVDYENSIIATFKKSANVILASHTVNKTKLCTNRDDELKTLMALSRAGFFCQRRGYESGAEELYRLAVDYARLTDVKCKEYSRELAVMLANYATVVVHKDTELAKKLYEEAVATCPTDENVSNAAASFFVLTANYAEGRACIERLVAATTTNAVLQGLYGKLAWLGVVCWDELLHEERLLCLKHMLFALGTESDAVVAVTAKSQPNPFAGPLPEDFKQRLLRGVTISNDQETVSLACYIAQTKLFHEGRFINSCYKVALKRFPQGATILVNYAKFCGDYNAVVLARKYYAKAFALSHTDLRITECYAHYLAFLNGGERQRSEHRQVVCGESLVRFQVERSALVTCAIQHAQSLTLYGNYVATSMPSPSVPVVSFEEALRLNPADSRATSLYCSFLSNVYGSALDMKKNPEAKEQLARKVTDCYLSCLKLQPHSVAVLTGLGSIYIDLGGRFEDAVRVLERARQLSPNNPTVHRLLCTAFHEEWVREQQSETTLTNKRLQWLLTTTHKLYEATIALEPTNSVVLARYCQFAHHGLQDNALATQLMQRLRELSRE
ncbi:uncharacterized protein TEOVI_000114300 [Trypanosoma equiperdum]|uniref:Uncharacterized protein n=1 Tax=Trypanosoma equiperdum TaxID=5694 RepID=A0A1G4IBJ6_TRYEQ|nr:hypothetical protein, conserved [Trypanosoma equiperdum]